MKRLRNGVRNTLNTSSYSIRILRTSIISVLVISIIIDTGLKVSYVLYKSLVNNIIKTIYKRIILSRKR